MADEGKSKGGRVKISAVILAGGRARRFGRHKLLAAFADGQRVIDRTVSIYKRAGLPVTVVVSHRDEMLLEFLQDRYRIVSCVHSQEGMAGSIRCGIRACMEDGSDGVLMGLGDMPWVSRTTLLSILEALRQGAQMVAPALAGRRGHPVAFHRCWFPLLMQLYGDCGARDLIERHRQSLRIIPVTDRGIVEDIDIPEDMVSFQQAVDEWMRKPGNTTNGAEK